jgi:PleD family two-component response regulator
MLTEQTPLSRAPDGQTAHLSAVQKVAIVNGTTEILSVVESVLAAGHYDVVMIESTAHAYSHIKRVQPNLVILCVGLDDMEGFQVLSMLKLDEETRHIPVLTHTDNGDSDQDDGESEGSTIELFAPQPAVRMN